jgi:hypothetical protein
LLTLEQECTHAKLQRTQLQFELLVREPRRGRSQAIPAVQPRRQEGATGRLRVGQSRTPLESSTLVLRRKDEAVQPAQQATLARFTAACQRDERVIASFLGGSYATDTSDAYSDLDLYLITTDEAYAAFFAERKAFLKQLGEPVLQEDFNDFGFDMILFIFTTGVEGELALGREGAFDLLHGGPFTPLIDKKGILTEKVFPWNKPTEAAQREICRHLLYWFWRDLSHFAKVVARSHLWAAQGDLEKLRLTCLNLIHLRYDPTDWPAEYLNLETAPQEQLQVLHLTFVPPERTALLQAMTICVSFYREHAIALAKRFNLLYPADLDKVVCNQVEKRCQLQLKS